MTYLYISDDLEFDHSSGKTVTMGKLDIDDVQRYLSAVELFGEDLTLVGRWENDGTVVVVDQEAYEQYFQTFNNDVDGFATDDKNVHYFQGHLQRQMQDPEEVIGQPEYPADNQPFALKMEHHEITEGTWQGHGWKCTMLSDDPNRDILARAIGIYSDPECANYLYTTGAFIMTDTDEVDEEDQPILRPMTLCPLGQLKSEKEPIYFALLLGSAQEGIMTLPTEQDSITRNFWLTSQAGGGGEVSEWAVGIAYAVGDIVTWNGAEYSCRQAHTSIASWTPAVLSLWLPV